MIETNRASEPVEPQAPRDDAEAAPPEAVQEESNEHTAASAAEPGSTSDIEAELAETKDRLLRALAETENLRRRSTRELEDAQKYAMTSFARDLLDVADNLSRALTSIPSKAREEIDLVKNLADGVAMTEKSLLACFERHRIAKVLPELGERFDHNRHQAMFELETADQPAGTVAQVLQPGYVIADRLLRPALVGVAKAAEQASAPAAGVQPTPANDDQPAEGCEPGGPPPGGHVDTTA